MNYTLWVYFRIVIVENNLYIKIGKLFTNIICISIIYSVENVYIYLNENCRNPPPQYKCSRFGISGDFLVKHVRTDYFDSNGLYDLYNYISKKTPASYIDVKSKS